MFNNNDETVPDTADMPITMNLIAPKCGIEANLTPPVLIGYLFSIQI